MFKSKAMKQLEVQLSAKEKEAQDIINKDDVTVEEIEAAQKAIKNIKAKVDMQKGLDNGKEFDMDGDEIKDKNPVNTPIFAEPKAKEKPLRLFNNFHEQLKAVKNATKFGKVDDRLAQINTQNAALGVNESNPDEGGYAIQSDFAGMMMESAAKAGDILPLVDQYEVSGNSNRINWVEIDEKSVETTVYGGVQVYWAAEATAVAKSRPKLIEKEMKLHKLMGVAYDTYEAEADSNFLSQLFTNSFTLAIQRELENTIINGNGVGKPLGFLKGGNLVTSAKKTDQVANTIVWDNISAMYHRAINKANPNYRWLTHPDASEQFDFLEREIGTGGVPLYLPAALEGSVATVKGKKVIDSDHCSALGTKGDINYVDLFQYMLAYKGGIDAATSMHVQFLTAENCFRFIFRANGMPKKSSALKIKNSTKTRSPFSTLETRA